VRKISKGNSLRRGISTAIIAVIAVILVVAVGAGVYFYTASTVTPSTTTNISTSIGTTTKVSTVTVGPSPVTISVVETYAPSASPKSELGAFNKSLAAFEAAYPYITVNIVTKGFSNTESDFETAALAGKAPDIVRGPGDWTGTLAAEGTITPLDGFVNSTFLGQYQPNAVQDYSYNGHVWGLAENVNYLVLIYNKALVSTPPTTLDQLLATAQSITKTDQTGKITTAGFVFASSDMYQWAGWLKGFGGNFFGTTASGKPIPTVNSSYAVSSIQFINSLINQYKVMPPGTTWDTMRNLFLSGHAGMMIDGQWEFSSIKQANATVPSYGVAPLPTVTSTGIKLAPFIGSQGWYIASGKPAAETAAAFKFVSWMTSAQSQKNLITMAGDLPSITALASDPSVTGNPDAVGSLAELAQGQPTPNTPELGALWTPVGGALGLAEPTTASQNITAAQIQGYLNTAETSAIKTIESL